MIKKRIGAALCCLCFIAFAGAQNKLLQSPARKLQLAEFAIANLYVDSVNENKLVESAIVRMLEELDRIPLIPIRKR